jgi:hypothetical protein
MEIDSERQEDMVSSPPHPSIVQRETIEPTNIVEPVDPVDHVDHVDVLKDIKVCRKWPAWAHQTLREEKGHAIPCGTFRESKRPQRFSSYVAAMSHIIDSEPS